MTHLCRTLCKWPCVAYSKLTSLGWLRTVTVLRAGERLVTVHWSSQKIGGEGGGVGG